MAKAHQAQLDMMRAALSAKDEQIEKLLQGGKCIIL